MKPAFFFLALIPAGLLAWKAYAGTLSVNPIAEITDETGIWTLRFIVMTLSVTPLRRLSGWSGVARLRRMFGLFAFFYACLHFTTFVYLDKFFDLQEMLDDVVKRPFITVGFASFLLMMPLAATSTDRITRWVGGKNWKRLHRLIYVIALGGVIHYIWRVKADLQRPMIYAILVGILLAHRLWVAFSPRLFSREKPQDHTIPA